jgi:predicted MFS family arabinose efflux permease
MRWISSIALAALGSVVILGNLVGGVRAKRARRNFSAVPFVAAGLLSLALVVCPEPHSTVLLPLALVIDFTVPMALYAAVTAVTRRNG